MKVYTIILIMIFSQIGTLKCDQKYPEYDILIKKNINIEGYRKFDYALWQHPLQLNMELQTWFIKPVLDSMKKVIPEESVILDIGAHSGDTSVAYSVITGPKGKVIAFEPNFAVFEVLKVNAQLNPNIIPVNKAITEKDGTYLFHYTDSGLCNGGFAEMLSQGIGSTGNTPLKVKGINLERWLTLNYPNLIKKIKFIKIDTEGYDKNILKSIAKLVKKIRPIIQCEIFPHLTKEEKIEFYGIIKSLGYRCYFGAIDKYEDGLSKKKSVVFEEFINFTGHGDILCFPN